VTWRDLPPLPRALGGAFAGVSQGRLLVAGGSYWEGAPWIPGSRKVFTDSVYALDPGARHWRPFAKLPTPSGYGASFTREDGFWLVGGQDSDGAQNGIVHIGTMVKAAGKLPAPLMMMASVTAGGQSCLLGGQPGLKTALRSKDLQSWEFFDPWPGPGRFMAQATAAEGGVILAGGSDLSGGQRVFLKDAYRWHNQAWSKLEDLPWPVQAGFAAAPGGLPLILGGSDGRLAPFEAELRERHPGFSKIIFKLSGGRWQPAGEMPYAPVTSTLVEWRGELVIPGGEDRPAHRSARVIAGKGFHD
jgi:N-acetylneuraminate epimerase